MGSYCRACWLSGPSKRERQQRPRESQVWERSVQAIGVPPSGVQWIHVGDRYSDMFPFLSLCREMQCDFVVRAAQDRCVDVRIEQADAPLPKRSHHRRGEQPNVKPTAGHLFDVVETWAAMGEQDLNLPASKQRKARVAHVKLSYGSLRLWPPETAASADLRPMVVWVIRVWEPEPAQDVEPLEWVLLTSLPIQSIEQAWERVDWYRARWIVEDYHQGLKTGCRVEQRQLQSYEGLRRLLGLLAPTAVRLLQLRASARQSPMLPASQTLPAEVVQVVAAKAEVPVAQLTTQECWHTIARFGGYLDGPPGWKTLWRGWLYIQALLEGVQLAARLSLDSSSDP